jgi:hypothetical protein
MFYTTTATGSLANIISIGRWPMRNRSKNFDFFAALCHVAIEARLVALTAPYGFWLKGLCASREARANLKMDHWSFTHATDGRSSTVAWFFGCRFI